MKIKGIDGLTQEQIQMQLQRGAKFVMYQYSISLLVITFKRSSDIYFVRAGEGSVAKGLGFSGVSLLLGWWGIPWGPIYTLQSFWVNFTGGRDVTREIAAASTEAIPQAQRA
jgi:hypothetical protein